LSEAFRALLDLGQHPPRLLELGFEPAAPRGGVAGHAPDRTETRLRVPQPLSRGLEALAQQLLPLADALARPALLGLGREQVERELLVVGDHAAALPQLRLDSPELRLAGLRRLLRGLALPPHVAPPLGALALVP